MTLTYPIPNYGTGEFIDEADFDAITETINFLANPPACRVYHNVNQSIPNGAITALTFNSERYDTAAMHSAGTNPTRITVPVAGLYLITSTMEFAFNATGRRLHRLRVNGADYIAAEDKTTSTASAAGWASTLATVWKCAANDYVEVLVFQDSGAAATAVSSGGWAPEFSVTWIGKGA